ncbi:MAG: PfkB family carbohydrate kinase [Patescibacteria group bacterium]
MNKKGKILVVGSVVWDTIFDKEFYGGTGANIAYGLGSLGAKPILFSLVGKDFKKDFSAYLKKSGVDSRVHINKKMNTASFSCVTNEKKEQIGVWKPNAYKNIHKISLLKTINRNEIKKVSIAIFSPGTPKSTYKHFREFKNFVPNALTIFDPGQMVNFYFKKQFIACFNLADILILNEIEYKQTKTILRKDPVVFFRKSNKIIIKTQGAKGSVIFQNGSKIKIKAVRPKHVIDTTGAGDAYRAGLIFGLWKGLSFAKSCAFGARLASKNIECLGCQKY